jgi:methyl-accepting chemotaxis protein
MSTWTLKRKLIGFGCMALATTLTLASGSLYLTNMFHAAFADYSAGMHAVQQSMLADMAHDAIRADVYVALNAGRANDAGAIAEASRELDEHIASMKNALASNDRATLPPQAKEALAKVGADLTPYHQSAKQIVGSASADVAAAESKLPEFLKRYSALEGSLAASGEVLEKMASEGMAASEKTADSGNLALGIIALCAVLIQLLICYLLGRSILKQVGGEPAYAAAVAKRIAEGDLSMAVDLKANDKDSMLAAIKAMQQQLTDIVRGIKGTSDAISSATTQIAAGNADLSSRTEQQASSLEETASSMEELTGTVKQNADNARQANQLAAGASTIAVKGGEVVGQVVNSMSSINESSRKIADIISVIDGIAFQTNILALNAAVEAARAGEQGRGFAVVASEVRTLAQRSAAAAKEIKALITDSVSKVEDGSKLVDQAGHSMEEIVSAVKRVTDIMAEIAAASQEQTSGIEQVNQAITQMDQTTQQNAALVEEAAAAAESMQEQAQSLTKAVAIFKLSSVESAPHPGPLPKHGEREANPRGTAGRANEGREASPRVTAQRAHQGREASPSVGMADAKSPSPRTRQEAPSEVKRERRGPNRPANVARLPTPAPQPKAAKTANGDDNWQEF